jgi:hypothetical protein
MTKHTEKRCSYSKYSLDGARKRAGEGCQLIGRLLGINLSLITRWVQQEDLLKATVEKRGVNKHLRHWMHPGRASIINKESEGQLMAWFDYERYNLFSKITARKIIRKKRELDAMFIPVNNKLLRRRPWRVFHRNRISTRAITHQAQVPRDCLVVIDNWAEYIKENMALIEITHNNICNFDETNGHWQTTQITTTPYPNSMLYSPKHGRTAG